MDTSEKKQLQKKRPAAHKSADSVLALLLAAVLLISTTGCNTSSAYVSETNDADIDRSHIVYTALSDSQADGYGLPNYFPEDWTYRYVTDKTNLFNGTYITEGPYPFLIQDYLENFYDEVTLYRVTGCSMRTKELRLLLDDSCTTDDYTEAFFYDGENDLLLWSHNLEDLKTRYRQAIEEADLITYEFGGNDLQTAFISATFSNYFDISYDIDELLAETMKKGTFKFWQSFRACLTYLINSCGNEKIRESMSDAAHFSEQFFYCLLGFFHDFDITIGKIYELNPDVKLIVVGMENLSAGLDLEYGNLTLPADKIYRLVLNAGNYYMKHVSPYHDQYLYTGFENRVRFNIDDLAEYEAGSELCAELDYIINECDWTTRFKYSVAQDLYKLLEGEELATLEGHSEDYTYYKAIESYGCTTEYEDAVDSASEKLAELLQPIAACHTIKIGDSDESTAMREALTLLSESLSFQAAAEAANSIRPGSASEEDIRQAEENVEEARCVLQSDEIIPVFAYYLRYSFGHTAGLSHPDLQGHQEKFESLKENIDRYLSL